MKTQIETKWTPGPWKIEGGDKTRLYVRAELRFNICKVMRLDSLSETEANARLIASLPELADGLKWAMTRMPSASGGPDWTENDLAEHDKARAALRKAGVES